MNDEPQMKMISDHHRSLSLDQRRTAADCSSHARFPLFQSSPWEEVINAEEASLLHKGYLRINLQGVSLQDNTVLDQFKLILSKPDRLRAISFRGCFKSRKEVEQCASLLGLLKDGIQDLASRSARTCHFETLDLGCTNFSRAPFESLHALLGLSELCVANLSLHRCCFSAGQLAVLLQLVLNSKIRVLDLSQTELDPDCFNVICEAISKSASEIHSLDLSSVTVRPINKVNKCWQLLARALGSPNCILTNLYLDGNFTSRLPLPPLNIINALFANSSLCRLTVDQSTLPEEAIERLGALISARRAPAHLSLRQCRLRPSDISLLTATAVRGPAASLSSPSAAAGGRPPKGPCFLDLGWNSDLRPPGCLLPLLALLRSPATGGGGGGAVVGGSPLLTGLGLQGLGPFAEAAGTPARLAPDRIYDVVLRPASFGALTALDLANAGVTPAYAAAAAAALAAAWGAQRRRARGGGGGGGGVGVGPLGFSPPLRHLNLNNNPLGHRGAAALGAAMERLVRGGGGGGGEEEGEEEAGGGGGGGAHPLRTLCLSGCHIGREGAAALCRWLAVDHHLTYLELHPQDRFPGFPLPEHATLLHEPLPLGAKLAFLSALRRRRGAPAPAVLPPCPGAADGPPPLPAPEALPSLLAGLDLGAGGGGGSSSSVGGERQASSAEEEAAPLLPAEMVQGIFAFCELPVKRTVHFQIAS